MTRPRRTNRLTPETAKSILNACNAPIGGDFHALTTTRVLSLAAWAESRGYREPKNANGSRARYFHDYLQRAAARRLEP